eukprot:SAG11_NODE_2841_length_2917_cov_2.825701_4_plen_52_part_00
MQLLSNLYEEVVVLTGADGCFLQEVPAMVGGSYSMLVRRANCRPPSELTLF